MRYDGAKHRVSVARSSWDDFMAKTPSEVMALCREKDVKAVDLRFMDFPGLWQLIAELGTSHSGDLLMLRTVKF